MHLAEVILVIATTNCFTTFSVALAGKSQRQKRAIWNDGNPNDDNAVFPIEAKQYLNRFGRSAPFRDDHRFPRRRFHHHHRPGYYDRWDRDRDSDSSSSSSEDFDDWARRRGRRRRPVLVRDFVQYVPVPVPQSRSPPVLPNPPKTNVQAVVATNSVAASPQQDTPVKQASVQAVKSGYNSPTIQAVQASDSPGYNTNVQSSNTFNTEAVANDVQAPTSSGTNNPPMIIHITFGNQGTNTAAAVPVPVNAFVSNSNPGFYSTPFSGSIPQGSIQTQQIVQPFSTQQLVQTSQQGNNQLLPQKNYYQQQYPPQNYDQAQAQPSYSQAQYQTSYNGQPIYAQAQPQRNYKQQDVTYAIQDQPSGYSGTGRPVKK